MVWTAWTTRLNFHHGSPTAACLRGVLYKVCETMSATWVLMIRPTGFTLNCSGASTISSMRTGMGDICLASAVSRVASLQRAFTLKDSKSGVRATRPIPS